MEEKTMYESDNMNSSGVKKDKSKNLLMAILVLSLISTILSVTAICMNVYILKSTSSQGSFESVKDVTEDITEDATEAVAENVSEEEGSDNQEDIAFLEQVYSCFENGQYEDGLDFLEKMSNREAHRDLYDCGIACIDIKRILCQGDLDSAREIYVDKVGDLPGSKWINQMITDFEDASYYELSYRYESARKIYESYGEDYKGLVTRSYLNEADHLIEDARCEEAGEALLHIALDKEYLDHNFQLSIVEDGRFSVKDQYFSYAEQYWGKGAAVFSFYSDGEEETPEYFVYRFTKDGKFRFCTYDMNGTYVEDWGGDE